jgi:hypothetical protein
LKKQPMNLGFVGIRSFVPQAFLHTVADSREQSRTSQNPFFLAHGPRLPYFGQ